MKSLQLKSGIHWIGALDPDLRIFDIIMHTEFGTTYNSYLVQGSEKTAVFETVKAKYWDSYLEKLQSLTDVSKIDYIVVDHTEPDHAGSVEKLLEVAPRAKVVGSAAAIRFLKGIANRDFESIVVNTNDTLDLGGKTLKFISAPFLHWPDSIYTYVPEDKVLFTCDSFGSHYCLDEVLYSKITRKEDYLKALKYYFDMIMGPFKTHMLNAIEKIEHLAIDMICNGHGPVLDQNPWEIVNICKAWSTESNPNQKKTVVIPYVSAYGYTTTLADSIEKGLLSTGDIDVIKHDMVYADFNTVLNHIYWADGLLLGSPTVNSEALPPIWNILTSLSPVVHGRKWASAFGSYGWSGEAVPNLTERLKQLRMQVVPGLKINFKPSENELEEAFAFGLHFGNKVLGKDVEPINIAVNKRPQAEGDGTLKNWRCVICNEVFEGVEPPEICPACGANHEQFEEYLEIEDAFTSSTSSNIVIIGSSAAGVAAAEAIRKRDTTASILMITEESEPPYYRPLLSDYISGDYNKKHFHLHEDHWYVENQIQLRMNSPVTQLLTEEKALLLADGQRIHYEKLILANGSSNFMPAITDLNKPGVFTLKDKNHADAIIHQAETAKTAIIVGGGLLGLELAWELRHLGLEVSIVEFEDRLLPKQLDFEGSSILEAGILKTGIGIYKNAQATAVLGDQKVTGLQLYDGRSLAADMIVVSVGIRPNTALVENTGIDTKKGILVDDHMRTSLPDIFACGDVAEFESTIYGIWPVALEQGRTAGANVVGDDVTYKHTLPSNVFNGMNMHVFSIGDIGTDDTLAYKTLVDRDDERHHYKKFYFVNDRFVGGILMGDVSKSLPVIRAIARGDAPADIIREIILK